jgi:hypothetical protein
MCRLWNNVKKYGKARQISDDNIIWCMRFAGWITTTKDTLTHNKKYLLLSHGKIVKRKRLNITLHVRCPSCFIWGTMN